MRFSIKDSIKVAHETFAHLYSDKLAISIGNIWSIKKNLLLDYYMPAFIKIVCSKNSGFKKCYFADPFCGSGIFTISDDSELKDDFFPGSALIGALNAAKSEYTDCIFSESNNEYISVLNSRLKKSEHILGKIYTAQTLEFKDAVEKILQIRTFGTAILILIDPAGYEPIKWNLMEKLIKEIGVDIILNFYTSRIAQNVSSVRNRPEFKPNLNEFFGDNDWEKIPIIKHSTTLGKKLLDHYIQKIKRISGKYVFKIGVYKDGDSKLYDLILITRSYGGAKVMEHAKQVMESATTKIIKREFKVQTSFQLRLNGSN